mmetsp:Transcript_1112/g.2040  ORF Transcript_1112/g.2040 Transcript_1112/m.2040 type:complete len:85 (+) Transcript_1112:604-858(+)
MRNFVQVQTDQGTLNASLNFYYLNSERESSGYEIYRSGGYLGITPSSWSNPMGLFAMMKHMPQYDRSLNLKLYQMRHIIGLELH